MSVGDQKEKIKKDLIKKCNNCDELKCSDGKHFACITKYLIDQLATERKKNRQLNNEYNKLEEWVDSYF